MNEWIFHEDASYQGAHHGVMVGNGMVSATTAAEPFRVDRVILNGTFDTFGRGMVSNILEGFNGLNIEVFVNNVHLKEENTELSQHVHLKKAYVETVLENNDVRITHRVLALRNLPFCFLSTVHIEAKKTCSIMVQNPLKAPPSFQDIRQQFEEIDRPHALIPLMTSTGKSPSGNLEIACSTSVTINSDHDHDIRYVHEAWDADMHLLKLKGSLEHGHSIDFSFYSAQTSTQFVSDAINESKRLALFCFLEGTPRLFRQHVHQWEDLWKSSITITGDPEVQRDVRLMLYYLYSSLRKDFRLSLSPAGLSNIGYNGHVFWDTELWMYPSILILNPALAKSIIDYRVDRLKDAQKNAKLYGHKGARYPWESAIDGTEQTPIWALTGPFQQHISACVSWAMWLYYCRTQDVEWLRNEGFPVMKEIATFWCDRVEREDGVCHIRNVIGANEFEENIDNNAFTNGIVKLTLRNTTKAARIINAQVDPDWDYVADRIPILYFEDGVTRENETYNGQIIKQADVNLLAHPLQYYSDPEQIMNDFNYYKDRYDQAGPAMGFSTLATIEAMYGDKEKAYTRFIASYQENAVGAYGIMSECKGGHGVAPYFLTGAGGVLQTILMGFGGLRITEEGLNQDEQVLPSAWESLDITYG